MVDVRIENVYKYYGSMGDVAAVHDLTMDIKDGEFVAILDHPDVANHRPCA